MTNKYAIIFFVAALISSASLDAQIAINTDGSAADPSAVLELSSTDKGFLMPKLTYAQRSTLAGTLTSASEGLMVYQTDNASGTSAGFYLYEKGIFNPIGVNMDYKANVNMGLGGLTLAGNIPSSRFTMPAVGEMDVDMSGLAGYSASSVILLAPEFLPDPSAPRPPNDYCALAFSGTCNNRYENKEVVLATAGEIVPWFATYSFELENYIYHTPAAMGMSCDNIYSDYVFYDNDGSALGGGLDGGNPYNQAFAGFATSISSFTAGGSFDIYVSGNQQASLSDQHNTSVFIDWNSDGDYFDSVDGISEVVLATPVQQWPFAGVVTNGVNAFTLPIPTNAVNGDLGMRVIASRFINNQSPCVVDIEGSAMDYIFTVTGGATASRPGQGRTCNVHAQTASGFEVRCYDKNGNPVNTKVYVSIDPTN